MTQLESEHQASSTISSHALTFAKFCAVGGGTAAIYFLIVWSFEAMLGLNYIAAISIAFFVSTAFHYSANRRFTFAIKSTRHTHQIFRYMVMLLLNYLVTIVVVYICVERLQLSPYTGVWISLIFTTATGFFLARHWVFNIAGATK